MVAMHLASPTKASMKAAVRVLSYLLNNKYTCMQANWSNPNQNDWEYFSDSDFCATKETRFDNCAMLGYIALNNLMPVLYRAGKCTSASATVDIAPPHTNVSVAASEIFALSEACNRVLGISYVADELNINMEKPFLLRADNSACIAFKKGIVNRTRLVQIDCRATWVRQLRNNNLFSIKHVASKENLSDLFTKVLDRVAFQYLRNKFMATLPEYCRNLQVLG